MNGPATFRDQYALSNGIFAPHNSTFKREKTMTLWRHSQCGRDIADLLPADDPIAEPPRQPTIVWQWLRSGRP
jgi:hypothetical protein